MFERSESSEYFEKILSEHTYKKCHIYLVTIKLNTASWKPGGETSAYNYRQIIAAIQLYLKKLSVKSVITPIGWELDRKCQLHCHFLIKISKKFYIKKLLFNIKKVFPKYVLNFRLLPSELDVYFANKYCHKSMYNAREYYSFLMSYLKDKPSSISISRGLLCESFDIEVVKGVPFFVDSCRVNFLDF